jgi:hypothetical protein
MSASSNAVRLPSKRFVTKIPSAVLIRVTHPNRNEARAYETYRAYCELLDTTPLCFDAWRVHSRRLFQNSLSSDLRVSRSESVTV